MQEKLKYSFKIMDWDSEQLGLKTARLLSSKRSKSNFFKLDSVIKKCQKEGIQYLVARFDIKDWIAIQYLMRANFETVDIILNWKLDLQNFFPTISGKILVRPFINSDLSILMKIARVSFIFDRYHSDNIINKRRADMLHAQWIKNSCAEPKNTVLVAELNRIPVGFISLKFVMKEGVKTGVIDLVAVDSHFRKHSIGQTLVEKALEHLKKIVKVAEVGTQLRNFPAWNLYQKVGFGLNGAFVTLRSCFKKN